MKIVFQLVLITLVFFISHLCSCTKKEDVSSPIKTPSLAPKVARNPIVEFNYRVNGDSIMYVDSVKADFGELYSSYFPNGTRFINIMAYSQGKLIFDLSFYPNTDTQKVSIDSRDANVSYLNYTGFSGTLHLTTCDTINGKIEGTFNFIGEIELLDTGGFDQAPMPDKSKPPKIISDGHIYVTKFTTI
jgi:hypothetical protein